MKILLIQPPAIISKSEGKSCQPPLGLAYLAAVLRKEHDVQLLDCVAEGFHSESTINGYLRYGLGADEIRRRIHDGSPDIVGVSCLFSSAVYEAAGICKIAKELNPSIITLMGGAHPSAVPEEILKDTNVDYVVVGEGERSLRELIDFLEGKRDKGSLKGVAYRDGGRIAFVAGEKIEDLDALPFPAWDMLPLERYFAIKRPHGGLPSKVPFFPVMTSRGCPYKCIFCSIHTLWGRRYRPRSAESVLSELRYLKDNFGAREIFFEDDNLTLDKTRAKKIFQGMIERDYKMVWSSPNGVAVNTIDGDMLRFIKKSGCRALAFGIESGDNYVLNNIINKPVDVPHAEKVIGDAGRLGIETSVFFVIGFPDETRSQLANTVRLAERLRADNVNFFFATPLPGTELYDRCVGKGLIGREVDYRCLHSGRPHFDMPDMSKKELEGFVVKERLKIHRMLLVRKPYFFAGKVFKKLLNDPWYFLRAIKKACSKYG